MPVEKEFDSLKKYFGEVLFDEDGFTAYGINDGMRKIISLEGDIEDILIHSFNNLYETLTELNNDREEPMMNILFSFDPEYGWRIIIFLRSKHRPSRYFIQGNRGLLISPAAVDLGGICITPLEKDFEKITREDLIEIFQEVSIGKEHFEFVKSKLATR